MGKSSGKLFIRIFHIRQINIHISFQQPKGFHIFISAGIIHYRQHQSLSSGDFQGGNNLRYIVSTCHQIQIRRPLLLQLQKNICKPLHRNLFSAVPNGNIPVLTKAAAQSAAWKKYSSGAFFTGNTGLLPHMKSGTGSSYSTVHAAIAAHSFQTVHFAFPRTQGTIL